MVGPSFLFFIFIPFYFQEAPKGAKALGKEGILNDVPLVIRHLSINNSPINNSPNRKIGGLDENKRVDGSGRMWLIRFGAYFLS